MIPLGIMFCFLAVLALFPVILVGLGKQEGSLIDKIVGFISEYDGILISLGTLILVSFLAYLTTYVSNRSSERREKANRRVQSELKVAEFRQAWINEMRDDITRLSELLFFGFEEEPKNRAKYISLLVKVKMRLNLDEELARNVLETLNTGFNVRKSGDSELEAQFHTKLAGNAGLYLKAEWTRLKKDLRDAQLLEGDPK